MIKVLIVDDHSIVREGIKCIIEQDPDIEVVGTAADGEEAFDMCGKLSPDVVLMDLTMPGRNGVEGTLLIKNNYESIKVIILTIFSDDENVTKALNNGADGYILKDIKPIELIITIKSVALGLSIMQKNTFSSVVKHISNCNDNPDLIQNRLEVKLSPREMDLLRLLADGRDNREIAANLFLSEGSVRNLISGVLRKLNLRDRIHLVIYAVKNGIF